MSNSSTSVLATISFYEANALRQLDYDHWKRIRTNMARLIHRTRTNALNAAVIQGTECPRFPSIDGDDDFENRDTEILQARYQAYCQVVKEQNKILNGKNDMTILMACFISRPKIDSIVVQLGQHYRKHSDTELLACR